MSFNWNFITIKEFIKHPIAIFMFAMLMAIGYLYLRSETNYTRTLENCITEKKEYRREYKEQIDDLQKENRELFHLILEIHENHE